MIQSRPQFGYQGAPGLGAWPWSPTSATTRSTRCSPGPIHQLQPAIPATSPVSLTGFALVALALAAVGYDKIHLAQRAFAVSVAIPRCSRAGRCSGYCRAGGAVAARRLSRRAVSRAMFAPPPIRRWSIYVSDYSRYRPRTSGCADRSGGRTWGLIGGAWMMLVGTVAAAVAPKLDLAAAMEFAADQIYGLRPGALDRRGARSDRRIDAQLLRRIADALSVADT